MTLPVRTKPELPSFRLALYRVAARVLGPLAPLLLHMRARRGKEDPQRLGERLGHAGVARPKGRLIWIHGASVGETLAALPVIERLLSSYDELSVLVTSGTVTSARILEQRLAGRAIHQFAPIDHPSAIRRFLEHWRPDLVFFMESELWPNILTRIARAGIPLALLNARMSDRSFTAWLRAPRMARALLASFDLCLAQDTSVAGRLESLGARKVAVVGNLKFAAEPLPADERSLETFRAAIAGRRLWLAASTHDGEERMAAHVHAALKETIANVLTLIVPRHPSRGAEIADMLADMGLKVALRSNGDAILPATDVYVADTIGELGIFYRLADIVFMGGSLVPHGGQNPLEPARLHSAIIFGPHTENFFIIYRELSAAGAAIAVQSRDQLAREIAALIASPTDIERMAEAGLKVCVRADGVISRVMAELEPLISSALGPSRETRLETRAHHASA